MPPLELERNRQVSCACHRSVKLRIDTDSADAGVLAQFPHLVFAQATETLHPGASGGFSNQWNGRDDVGASSFRELAFNNPLGRVELI